MSDDLTVLLMGTLTPSEQLKSLLEKQRVFGDHAKLGELNNMVRLADPALIVHFGKEGAQEVVTLLKDQPVAGRVRLVVVANRSELTELRKLDREIVASLLATDMPDSVLAARIAMLAKKRGDTGSRDLASSVPPPSATVPPVGPKQTRQLAAPASQAPAPVKTKVPTPSADVHAEDPHAHLNEKTVEVSVTEAMALLAPMQNVESESPPREAASPPAARDIRGVRPGPTAQPERLPGSRHVLVADSDFMRGDAIARSLRQSGVTTLLVPLDPAKTRWPLLRQFAPEMLVVDGVDLTSHGQVWHQLLLADQALSNVRLVALPLDTVFDETTGVVDLQQLVPFLPELNGVPHREPLATLAVFPHDLADLDPTGIEEMPASDRPTYFNQDLSGSRPGAEETQVIPSIGQARPPVTKMRADLSAHEPEFRGTSPLSRNVIMLGVVAAVLVGVGVALIKGGGLLGPSEAQNIATPPAKPKIVDGDAHAPAPPKPEPISPWIVAQKEEVKSCEDLVPNIEDLRRLGLGQANISWNDARKALVLGNIVDAHRSLCESSLIHAEGLGVEGLVELLLSKHAPEQAATWMAFAKSARPDRRKTLDLQGDVLSQQGKVDEARLAWATALGVKPDDEKATKGIGDHYETEGNTFLKSENWAKAEIMFRRAATLNPKSAGAAAGLARTLLAQGYTEHAELWSDTALSLQPDLGLALVVRADLRLMAGDQAGAVDLYKQALKTDPGNPRAHQQIFRLTEQK